MKFMIEFCVMYVVNVAYSCGFALNLIHYDYAFIGCGSLVMILFVYLCSSDPGRYVRGSGGGNNDCYLADSIVSWAVYE